MKEARPEKQPDADQPGAARPGEGEYNEEQIKYLTDLEHVRHASGMYIGDKTGRGMHHLVYEVVDNSIDEAMAGYAKEIQVVINVDGSVTVADDGRGIPVGRHEQLSQKEGRDVSTLEAVMTKLHVGGKFDKRAYKSAGGLHGIGVKAVNFLSDWCEVEVRRDGHVYQQEYERGKPTGPVTRISSSRRTGTKVTFKVDPEVFGSLKFDYNILQKRLRELAFLNRGVKISLRDERTGDSDTFQYDEGLVAFIKYLNRATEPVHPDVIYFAAETNGTQVEVALQYSSEYTENVHTYVNNINTEMGGTHLSGFRTALTRTLNTYGKKNIFKEKDLVPTGEDLREGLTAVISVRLAEPQFESQTKVRCLNAELEGIVSSTVTHHLGTFLEEHPKTARSIIEKAMLAAEAREAARHAKKALRERKNAIGGGGLPGKLRDCISREMEKCELYLVEGDSAGGSAEGGRLKQYQAILPLRGKIINAYKSRDDKVLANEEVQSIIRAVDSGIGDEQDINKRRYGKIIIMTDADVDGSHIRTLLLCFFYRQMYDLVAAGHVYIAQPPLFRVRSKKETYYVQTEEEMKEQLLQRGLSDAVFDAGDGRTIEGEEMVKLCRVLASMEDALLAMERRGISLKVHAERMDVQTGKLPVFHVYLGRSEHWFTTRAAMEKFLKEHEEATGAELSVSDAPTPDENGQPPENGHPGARLHITELHEVRTLNTGLKELAQMGFDVESLISQERTGVEQPRYALRRGDSEMPLENLRGLLAAVRSAGEKGLQVTRFKGLGEMNAEELRATTLDPQNRTLIKVSMKDVGAADEMFRVLMGDKVEPRRDFIEKHALEVRQLDV